MAKSRVIYRPQDDATPESELRALVAAYRFVIFDCHVNEKGVDPGASDAERNLSDSARDIIQDTK